MPEDERKEFFLMKSCKHLSQFLNDEFLAKYKKFLELVKMYAGNIYMLSIIRPFCPEICFYSLSNIPIGNIQTFSDKKLCIKT